MRPEPGTSAKQGDAIKTGTIVRLQHMKTRKWLHSHLHASPISGNLEVSFFFECLLGRVCFRFVGYFCKSVILSDHLNMLYLLHCDY